MKLQNLIKFTAAALWLLTVACANKAYNQQAVLLREDEPRMVYIDNEVQKLKTSTDIPSYRPLYVEVRTKAGAQQGGKLIRITEGEVIFTQQTYRKAAGDSLRKIENNVSVPKPEILILKVW